MTGIKNYAPSADFDYANGSYMHTLLEKEKLTYELDVTALLITLLDETKKSCFINVGANISYFPVLAGAVFGPRCEIHSFEPMPELFEMGKRGLELNNVTATARQDALANFVGEAEFHLSAQTDSSNSLNPTFRKTKSIVTVPVSTLDKIYLEEQASPSLNEASSTDVGCVLVIDTESTEPDVIEGGANMIAKFRPYIICEVLAGRSEERLMELMEGHGYSYYRLTNSGLVPEDTIVGDITYAHRDWLFAPSPLDAVTLRKYVHVFNDLQ